MLFQVIEDGEIVFSHGLADHDDTYHLPGQVEQHDYITANTSLTKAHRDVRVITGASDITVTLPASLPSNEVGRIYTIRKFDSGIGKVIIYPGSGRNIDGRSTFEITGRYDSITVLSGATNWYVISDSRKLEQAKITTVTANTTLSHLHGTVLVDATGGARTITLPEAAKAVGYIYTIEKIDVGGNVVTIDGYSSETINGSATQVLAGQWDYHKIHCDGSAWYIIG